MKRFLQLSFAYCCFYWLFLLACQFAPPPANGQNYASRNECVSHETVYEVKYLRETFEIHNQISFTVMSPVRNCYFSAENFTIISVKMTQGRGVPVKISLNEIHSKTISIRLLDGTHLAPNVSYTITFGAVKWIRAVAEGLVFKVYRDLHTMKMNWYSIVKIGPANCGKVYICIDSLRSVQKLIVIAVYPPTHRLLCPGNLKTPVPVNDGRRLRTECHYTYPVAVNNMHFSVTTFNYIEYNGQPNNHNLHRIGMVAPNNEFGQISHEVTRQFTLVQRIFSMLLLTTNIKAFNVIIYALPYNKSKDKPIIRSGSCYMNFDNIHFQLDMEVICRGYLRCLLHQGFMNDRISDAFTLLYAPEGLFEMMITEYEIYSIKSDFYRDALEGTTDDLAALAEYNEDVTNIRVNRPWRKSAGFFTMLGKMSPSYARATYSTFRVNNGTFIENTYLTFLHWITQHSGKLGLTVPHYLEIVDTWSMAEGYPVIVADVVSNRTVCVEHYNVGPYLRSYLLPVTVDFNFPDTVHSKTIWTNPRSAGGNCVTVVLNLYPYLINSYFNMVARVNYNVLNWRIWAEQLMKAKVRQGLGPTRKVVLVTDALYFAGQRKLSYKIALRFLFAMQAETSEEAWRHFDKTLLFLDTKIRYTYVYSLFKKILAEVASTYYAASRTRSRPSEMAHRWSCMMGDRTCLNDTEQAVEATLRDYRHRHLPEILCSGMRRLRLQRFHELHTSMGRPDWREPEFYVQMMLCAEDSRVLRELTHHLFFHNSWHFREDTLAEMVLKMIRASKSGSDAVFYYLNHDPFRMLDRLGAANMLLVVEELAKYAKENQWLFRLLNRFKMKRIVWEEAVKGKKDIIRTLKDNKVWYNTQYEDIRRFFMNEYGKHLRKFEGGPKLKEDETNVDRFLKI